MHPNPNSLYSNLPPAMNAAQQTAAFATLENARYALRSHLHKSDQVAQTIITHAKAAVNGEEGAGNVTRRYFEPNGPTAVRLQDYAQASDPADRSKALHALSAKQALYSECSSALKAGQKNIKDAPQRGVEDCAAYFSELRKLEAAYVAARNVIVTGNLRLVASVANKNGANALESDDLMQYGAIGLQKAVEAYKPASGNKFSTYAIPSIKGEILRAAENFGQEIRIPCHVWGKMRQYDHTQEELTYQLGRVPTTDEIAEALDIEIQEAEQLKQYHWEPVSIDAPVGEGEDAMTLGETLRDSNADFFRNDIGDYADFIQPYLGHLESLESEVLKKTIGYGFTRQMNMKEIALETGLSEDAICAAMKSGVAKIAAQRNTQSLAA